MKHFDAIIIGTGQVGPSLAARFSAAGMAVAIVERHAAGRTLPEHEDKGIRSEPL